MGKDRSCSRRILPISVVGSLFLVPCSLLKSKVFTIYEMTSSVLSSLRSSELRTWVASDSG